MSTLGRERSCLPSAKSGHWRTVLLTTPVIFKDTSNTPFHSLSLQYLKGTQLPPDLRFKLHAQSLTTIPLYQLNGDFLIGLPERTTCRFPLVLSV